MKINKVRLTLQSANFPAFRPQRSTGDERSGWASRANSWSLGGRCNWLCRPVLNATSRGKIVALVAGGLALRANCCDALMERPLVRTIDESMCRAPPNCAPRASRIRPVRRVRKPPTEILRRGRILTIQRPQSDTGSTLPNLFLCRHHKLK